jgi:hypothetical protein
MTKIGTTMRKGGDQKSQKARGFGSPHQMNRHEESGKTKSSLDDSFDLRTYYMLKEKAFESAPLGGQLCAKGRACRKNKPSC